MKGSEIEIGKVYAFQHCTNLSVGICVVTAEPDPENWGEDKETGMWTAEPLPNPHKQVWGVFANELSLLSDAFVVRAERVDE